jgi:hypothetical protein
MVIHPFSPKVCANKSMLIWTRGFWATPWFVSSQMSKSPWIRQSSGPSLNGTTFKLKHCDILSCPNRPRWSWFLVDFFDSLASRSGAMDPSLGTEFNWREMMALQNWSMGQRHHMWKPSKPLQTFTHTIPPSNHQPTNQFFYITCHEPTLKLKYLI